MIEEAVINRGSLKTHSQAEAEALAYIEKRRNGQIRSLVTPWRKFNEAHIDGIEMGSIITIAGMSSSGKSLICNQLQSEIFNLNPLEEFAILNFNFEMSSRQILIRHVISTLGISNRELLSADGIQLGETQLARVRVLLTESTPINIYYCEYPQTVEQYKKICKAFYTKYGIKFLIQTDHSVLFKKGVSEDSAVTMLYNLGDASIELKKDIDCTQIHISQLNRELEDPKRRLKHSPLNYPSKDCVFGGDSLYQCADTVLVNHRPSLLNFQVDGYGPEKLPCGPNDIYWHFLKIRQGIPHRADMIADFANFKILDKPSQHLTPTFQSQVNSLQQLCQAQLHM